VRRTFPTRGREIKNFLAGFAIVVFANAALAKRKTNSLPSTKQKP
jgi:hypothetical protein